MTVQDVQDITSFRWASVTAVSPLAIKLDGDTAALPLVPESLIDPRLLIVGDRVRVELSLRKCIIHGRAAGVAFAKPNLLINSALRTNQYAYASGTNIPIGTYAFDRIKASGVTNLITNPSAEGTLYTAASLTLTKDSSWAQFRTNSFKLVGTGTADSFMTLGESQVPSFFGLVAGKTYTISGYCKVITPTSGTAVSPAARVRGITVIGAQGGVTFESNSTQAVNTAGTVTRVSATFTVPLGTTAQLYIRVYLGSTAGTIQWDGLMLTEGSVLYPYFDGATTDSSWSGTADASVSYNVPNVVPTLTGTFDSNFGSTFALNANARVSQIVERSRVAAGTYTAAQGGTAQMRVYNNTTAPGSRPAFAAGPVTFTADGTDDVVVEFSGGGAGATIGQMRMFSGSTDFGFSLQGIADEFRDCQRYYRRWTAASSGVLLLPGQMVTSTIAYIHAPVDGMRTQPVPSQSGTLQVYRPGFVAGDPATFNSIALAGPSFLALQYTCNTANAASSALAYLYSSAGSQWLALDAEIR